MEATLDVQRRMGTTNRSGMNSSLLTHEYKVSHSNLDQIHGGMMIESSLHTNYGTNPPLTTNQYNSIQKRKEPSRSINNESSETFKRPSKEPRKTIQEERKYPQEENIRTNQKTFVSKNHMNSTSQSRQSNSFLEQSGIK